MTQEALEPKNVAYIDRQVLEHTGAAEDEGFAAEDELGNKDESAVDEGPSMIENPEDFFFCRMFLNDDLFGTTEGRKR